VRGGRVNAYATKAPPQDGLVHQAQFYESGQDFVDTALPFVREGVRAGEPVLARVRAANAAALRRAGTRTPHGPGGSSSTGPGGTATAPPAAESACSESLRGRSSPRPGSASGRATRPWSTSPS